MSAADDPLDTQTKSELQRRPPEKLAPPVVAGYSLVLLERGLDRERVEAVLRSLTKDGNYPARPCPLVVRRELSLADALEGQFELICTDSISVFVDDEVFQHARPSYLQDLFQTLRQSAEFELVRICVHSVPPDEGGRRFLAQFFGTEPALPAIRLVARKKARIMRHRAGQIGAVVEADVE